MIRNKLTKSVSCPKCGLIIKVKGNPESKIILYCPQCELKGCYTFPKENIKKEIAFQRLVIPSLLLSLSIIISSAFFYSSFFAFLSILLLVPFFFQFNFDFRIPIIFSIILFFISSIIISFYSTYEIANRICLYAYWSLCLGLICALKDYAKKIDLLNIRKIFG